MNVPFIYHIMIDRFADCDSERRGRCFKGGNLRGIIDSLDYIRSLGCNGVLLTPFYKTNEYHGYHITDYKQVDPHYGTWADVDMLVREVHYRGMTITADFVANHCHESNSLVELHPDWFKYSKNGKRKGFEGIDYLPEFNLNNPAARRYMIEVGLELCCHGFDAIRLDYAKGPSISFWKAFRKAVKASYPSTLLIGEVWGKPRDKQLPIQLREAVNAGRITEQEAWQLRYSTVLDGVLDFEYQSLMCHAAKSRSPFSYNKTLNRKLTRHFSLYADKPDFQLWLFLDNHDTNRFLYECRGNVDRLKEAIQFTRSLNRTTLLYYGTEKGMSHMGSRFGDAPYGDEQVRSCMEWDAPNIFD